MWRPFAPPKEHHLYYFGFPEKFVDKKPSQLRIFGSGWIEPSKCYPVFSKKEGIDKLKDTVTSHGHDGDIQRIKSRLRSDLGYTVGNILYVFTIDNFRQVNDVVVDVSSIRAGVATFVQNLDSVSAEKSADKVPPQSSLEKFFTMFKTMVEQD